MAVVLLTDDLITTSRVEGAARRVGVALRICSVAESAVSHCTDGRVERLIVDLTSRAGDVAALVERFREAGVDRPPMIAFGPHVHDKLLAAAVDAGCEQVVSRGQFFAELDAVFARLAGASVEEVSPDQDTSPGG